MQVAKTITCKIHNLTNIKEEILNEEYDEYQKICLCGCGNEVNKGKNFICGHNSKCMPEKTKINISLTRKRLFKEGKLIIWNKNKKMSKKQKQKISNLLKGHKYPKERNLKIGLAHSGKKLSKKTKSKIGEKNKKNMINYFKKYPEQKERMRMMRLNQKLPITDTSIELKVKNILKKMNIIFIHPFNLGGRFQCDFFIPKFNLIVECDGDYWHSLPNMINRDKAKNAYVKKCGYNLLRLTETEINNNIKECAKRIAQIGSETILSSSGASLTTPITLERCAYAR